MTSFRQIEVNRRNAQLSTGPVNEEAKKRSRQNAGRSIDGKLVHCRLPEMFGEPGRTDIELALRNPFGEDAV